MPSNCRFCDSLRIKDVFPAREMMVGLRDNFSYTACADCGSLRITEIPSDLSRYYPPDYLAFLPRRFRPLKRWLRKHRFRHLWDNDRDPIGWTVTRLWGPDHLVSYLKRTGVALNDAVLEVGCGSGDLLHGMSDAGFTCLTGVDPYRVQNPTATSNVRFLRQTVHETTGTYNLVVYNHSLEHVPDPCRELVAVAHLLAPEGRVLIRIPIAGNFASREYGPDWVQLDAPRHLNIPTETGFKVLASRTGYAVEDVTYDSTSFQFWGSEQYRRDIPLHSKHSHVRRGVSLFSKQDLRRWQTHAEALNASSDGDMASFILCRLPHCEPSTDSSQVDARTTDGL